MYCFGKEAYHRRKSKAQSGKEPIGVFTAGGWSWVGDQQQKECEKEPDDKRPEGKTEVVARSPPGLWK